MRDQSQSEPVDGDMLDGDALDGERERALHTLRIQRAFLDAFGQCGIVTWAAQRAGTSRMAVWRWRHADAEFAAAYDDAAALALGRLEREAVRRALAGVRKPVYWQGERVGYTRDYSDALLMFLLRARDPDTYRERRAYDVRAALAARLDVGDPSGAGETAAVAPGLSAATLDAIAGLLAADDGQEQDQEHGGDGGTGA